MYVALQSPLLGALMTWLNPLWMVGLGTLIALVVLWGLFRGLTAVSPKVAAIAWATAKEAVSQPLFYAILAFGSFGLLLFPLIPYNTFFNCDFSNASIDFDMPFRARSEVSVVTTLARAGNRYLKGNAPRFHKAPAYVDQHALLEAFAVIDA